ncbi:MAG: EAL domain-containing protein [Pseudomonadota bacterium]
MNSPPAGGDSAGEIAALITDLHRNIERLEHLTGGQVDTITDEQGRPFVLRHAQEQLRINDASRQHAILNALPAYVAMLDADGVIVSFNEAWQAFSNAGAVQGPGHAVGINYLQLCEEASGDGANVARQVAGGIRRVLSGNDSASSFEYACRADGVDHRFFMTVTPLSKTVGHGVVVMHMDISQRTRDEEELQRFRTAMDCTADAIFLLDYASMRFVEVNATACSMLGYERAELLEHDAFNLIAAGATELRSSFDSLIAASGSSQVDEVRLICKDKSSVIVEIHRQALRSGQGWIIVAVARDISERKEAESRLLYQAHHDGLTGLPNRALFHDTLVRSLGQAKHHQWTLAVLFIDLDNFKNVNDTLGHAIGDELLVQLSNRLLQCVRVRDTVGRFGGDEFGLLLVLNQDASFAAVVANKIRSALRKPFQLGEHEVSITASIGITLYPNDADTPDELIKFADTAMYRAKQAGRDTFRFFTAQMNVDVLERLDLEKALRKALENKEFVLHYQPKIALPSGRVAGMEALLRWERPGFGLIGPNLFIPSLEETGLIVQVGEWVLDTACRQIGEWLRSSVGPMPVAVNVAGRQLLEGDLEATVIAALEKHAIPPELLELELTESSLMVNTERTISTLKNVRARGVTISIDDFGTGYSSLAYLRRFPIDKLKIDIAFIREVTSNADDAAIVLAIIRMSHSLKLEVIAEGVETAEQLAYLKRIHCDQVQGYLFSRPLAVPALEELLRQRLPAAPQAIAAPCPCKTVLLVDDDLQVLSSLRQLLRHEGYHILVARSAAEGLELLAQHAVQVIVCEQRLPDARGTEFCDGVKELYPDTFRIVLAGTTDLEAIMGAVNRGAIYRFYTKPWDNTELRADLREAFRHYNLLHGVELAGYPGAGVVVEGSAQHPIPSSC